MSIEFACKCGKQLRAFIHQAGSQLQCPACGRAQIVPTPAPTRKAGSRWQIDTSAEAAAKAELAGVARGDRDNVARLWSSEELQQSLAIAGTLACWYCQSEIPFTGQVFGRVGLAGTLVNLGCPKCHARIWTGFSSHLTAEGTDVFIYAPSNSRSDGHSSGTPTLRIHQVTASDLAPSTSIEPIEKPLLEFEAAVGRKASYQETTVLASRLAEQPMSSWQSDKVCRRLQTLLKKETATHFARSWSKRSHLSATSAQCVMCAMPYDRRSRKRTSVMKRTCRSTIYACWRYFSEMVTDSSQP